LSAEPVSWLVIEPGWSVVAADGDEVGKVEEIVGDTGKDIFNGLAVSAGVLAKPKYVPAERVSQIVEGEVRLDLPAEAIERLDDHEPQPPSAEYRA
jgi:sporulation protein YlmC with PRC-barrel domain